MPNAVIVEIQLGPTKQAPVHAAFSVAQALQRGTPQRCTVVAFPNTYTEHRIDSGRAGTPKCSSSLIERVRVAIDARLKAQLG